MIQLSDAPADTLLPYRDSRHVGLSYPQEQGAARSSVPPLILAFFAADLALLFLYLANYAIGEPITQVSIILNLDGESNLPTWYSSMQWFCVAALLGYFVKPRIQVGNRFAWFLLALPLLFLAMSLDEVAQLHEWVGHWSDLLLPEGTRKATMLAHTGIWMFILGIPFALVFGMLIYKLRAFFVDAAASLWKIIAGVAVLLTGALGVELLSNFVESGSAALIVLTGLEEFLEMLGATIVLWGSYELASSGQERGSHGPAARNSGSTGDDPLIN